MHTRPLKLALAVLFLALLLACLFVPPDDASPMAQGTLVSSSAAGEAPAPVDAFGITDGAFDVDGGTVARGETLARLLGRHGVDYTTVVQMVSAAEPVFDVRSIRPGRGYRVYHAPDSARAMRYFVYESGPTGYVVFDVRDTVRVATGEREVEVARKTAGGTIDGSLFQTLLDTGAPAELSFLMAEMYAWQIDFYRLREGDRFRVVYEEEQVAGEPVGLGDILAAVFTHRGEDYYGFRFENDSTAGYFDRSGESLRKAFLQAPLRFSRISSGYDRRRFHPILKRVRPHLGTDYAAPRGTPVRSVGDGVVVRARYGRGNGHHVKIRHNRVYETLYLHLSKIAGGIEPGVRVRQGDTIGYVGSSGLATGPHLHYEFHENGRAVDPYEQELPSADPLAPTYQAAFDVVETYLPLLQPPAPKDLLAASR